MCRCAGIVAILLAGSFTDSSPGADPAPGQQVRMIERPPDPHGTPRPARDAREVPLKTSLYVELGMPPEARGDTILTESVTLHLVPRDGEPVELIRDGRFVGGASGWLRPRQVTLLVATQAARRPNELISPSHHPGRRTRDVDVHRRSPCGRRK